MVKNPTVSVIIPTYNRANLVGEAIKSVLKQTYQDFEIIIVDDGSTDNTKEVIRDFKDKRVNYVKYKKNKGVLLARNTGIKVAKGICVAFTGNKKNRIKIRKEKENVADYGIKA